MSEELDLKELQLLPDWAKQPLDANPYAHFQGHEEERPNRRKDQRSFQRRDDRRERKPGFGDPSARSKPGGKRPFRRDSHSKAAPPAPPAAIPLPEIDLTFVPEEHGLESLARQIKVSLRTYAVFDIARLILRKPERHHIRFSDKKKPPSSLFVCTIDDTIWLSEDEAIKHALNRHLDKYYKIEQVEAELPKGNYSFVAVCGMTGKNLGPPNYHDYQKKLRSLYTERFSHIPFDTYKGKIKIVRDEAALKAWLEEYKWKTEYHVLNATEPKKLGSREEMEAHFRQAHASQVVKSVSSHLLANPANRVFLPPPLQMLVRRAWDEQMRFPMKVVHELNAPLARAGLHFFKGPKGITYVSAARPRLLDPSTTPVSEGIQKILSWLRTHPGKHRAQLLEALVPVQRPLPASQKTPEAPNPLALTESEAHPASETPDSQNAKTPSLLPPEATPILRDLHWLLQQGHVLEFADARLELPQ